MQHTQAAWNAMWVRTIHRTSSDSGMQISSLNDHPPSMWENAFPRCSHSECEDGAWEEWSACGQDQRMLAVKWLKRFLVLPQWHSLATETAGLVSLLRLLCKGNHSQKAPPLVSCCNTTVLVLHYPWSEAVGHLSA